MALHSVILCTILAFSLASTEQCVSSAGSSIDLSLHSMKNASGHWIISEDNDESLLPVPSLCHQKGDLDFQLFVETRRLTTEEDPREISANIRHETKICGKKEIEQLIAVALVYPSLQDTSMSGAIEPSTPRTTSTTTTATTPPPPTTTITTTTPKSCPHSGYQLYPGFNCYKAFPSQGEARSWTNAREHCMGDGGDLMVIETEREMKEVYIPLYKSVSWRYAWPWLGVYIPQGGNNWMSVKGEPARSTWWRPGQPDGIADRKCAYAGDTGLLVNDDCEDTGPFICEISL